MGTTQQLQQIDFQLRALRDAGVPLYMPLADTPPSVVTDGDALNNQHLPDRYRQVIDAGSLCGHPTIALEILSAHIRRLEAARSSISSALIYPLTICTIAYACLVIVCRFSLPSLIQLHQEVLGDDNSVASFVKLVHEWLPIWIFIPPIVFALLFANWFFARNRARTSPTSAIGLLGWLPGIRSLVRDTQLASIAELTSRLFKNETDTGQNDVTASLELATNTVLGRRLTKLPPFLNWATTHPLNREQRIHALDLAEQLYEERAVQRSAWLTTIVPYAFIGLAGGSAVLGYALIFWMPFCQLMLRLSDSVSPY